MKLRKLAALILSASMLVSMMPASVLAQETKPIASYTFDDASLVNDVDATQSATALVTGLTSYNKDVVYEVGKDGTGHSVRIGNYGLKLNQTEIGKEFSLSFWVKLDSTLATNQVLVLMGHHSPENWMAVSGESGGYKFWGNGGILGQWKTVYSPSIDAGVWTNLTFCGQAGKITAYKNGVKLGTFDSNDPMSVANSDIYLGVNYWDPEGVGLVDDVKVYDTVLTEEEVKGNYD